MPCADPDSFASRMSAFGCGFRFNISGAFVPLLRGRRVIPREGGRVSARLTDITPPRSLDERVKIGNDNELSFAG